MIIICTIIAALVHGGDESRERGRSTKLSLWLILLMIMEVVVINRDVVKGWDVIQWRDKCV